MLSKTFAIIILLGTNFISYSQCRDQNSNCPDKWTRCGNTCVFASTKKVAWQLASEECKSIRSDSDLLILDNKEKDENIRRCLLQQPPVAEELWIDGIFNDKQDLWVIGATTAPLRYQAFSRRRAQDDSEFKCIVLNREVLYRWSSMECHLEKHFICEIR